MSLDPATLAVAFVLLCTILGALLFFAWVQNRRVRALAWWGATFCLVPLGIGMANLGKGPPSHFNLLVANALIAVAYGALYAGCRSFNGRATGGGAILAGAAVWAVTFPAVQDSLGSRIVILSVIAGAYAALSAWELRKHAAAPLASQRAAAVFLAVLAGFNVVRGQLALPLASVFWINDLASRWSTGMGLLLVIYAPALAFIFLAMAKERTEAALRESEDHYRYSVELNPQIPWTADAQANILTASLRWTTLTGQPVERAFGTGWATAVHPEDLPVARQRWRHATATGEPFDTEYRLRLADGDYRWFRARATARHGRDGSVLRWYGTLEDIHDRKVAEEHLRWAAYHDELTGLPNRRMFQERLQEAIERTDRTGRRVGLLMIDLDDFKQVNDHFGHDVGDELLKQFGKSLAGLVRATDIVARLGGDEFAVILPEIEGEEEVAATARAIQAPRHETVQENTGVRECRTSIGGAVSVGRGMDMGELLKRADLALYGSKQAGRGTFRMFAPVLREEAQKSASALEIARNVVASGLIVPFYQPKVALASGDVVGFEALLRWRHPRTGIQTPDTLAPAFEDMELGAAIGESMLACVLADMRGWLDAGGSWNTGPAVQWGEAIGRHRSAAQGTASKEVRDRADPRPRDETAAGGPP